MPIPFFSIIIPTYNRFSLLQIAIDSVLQQTFQDFELIIIDDGSTDKTQDYISSLKCKCIKHLKQEHAGVSKARNLGINNAQGEFIAFLDSDDRFTENKLSLTFDYINRTSHISIFHTEEIWFKNGALLNQKKVHKKPDGMVFEQALLLCCISLSTAVIKRSVFKEIGIFDEKLPVCEDYDFWLRATAKYPVKLINEELTLKAGGHPDQLSKRYEAMDQFRIYSIDKIIQANILTETQKTYAIEELKKKCRIYIIGALKRNKLKEANYCTQIMNKY